MAYIINGNAKHRYLGKSRTIGSPYSVDYHGATLPVATIPSFVGNIKCLFVYLKCCINTEIDYCEILIWNNVGDTNEPAYEGVCNLARLAWI